MVRGLLMELDDHNCWTPAEALGHRGPYPLQHLLSRAVWDDKHVVDIASAWAVSYLDDGDAVLIVDETADEKSSLMRGSARSPRAAGERQRLAADASRHRPSPASGPLRVSRRSSQPEPHLPAH
jgi:DDE superfamily endonuclease